MAVPRFYVHSVYNHDVLGEGVNRNSPLVEDGHTSEEKSDTKTRVSSEETHSSDDYSHMYESMLVEFKELHLNGLRALLKESDIPLILKRIEYTDGSRTITVFHSQKIYEIFLTKLQDILSNYSRMTSYFVVLKQEDEPLIRQKYTKPPTKRRKHRLNIPTVNRTVVGNSNELLDFRSMRNSLKPSKKPVLPEYDYMSGECIYF
jgi:hypothetical protein